LTRRRFIEFFGGCLPVGSTTDKLFLKSLGQLNGQREEHTNYVDIEVKRSKMLL